MRVVCADDEKLILGLTVSMCEELSQVDDVRGFDSGAELLAWLRENSADVALLDINMPDIDGIALAGKIREIDPQIAVVFLTGYAEYAVEAFSMHASGYLMKPISREKLSAELDYAMKNRTAEKPRVFMRTFGNFDVQVNGRTISFARSKSKELLAYLVDKQGSSVSRAEAFAVLWEEGVYDRSKQKQLDVVIRSLRETLKQNGIEDVFENTGGNLRVIPDKFDCDMYRFFDGEQDSIDSYRGEYMSSYSWASITEAYMDRRKNREQ